MGRERGQKRTDDAEMSAVSQTPPTASYVDALTVLIDHCSQAKLAAELNSEKFLAYMLAMAVEEAQTVLRRLHLGEPTPSVGSAIGAPNASR